MPSRFSARRHFKSFRCNHALAQESQGIATTSNLGSDKLSILVSRFFTVVNNRTPSVYLRKYLRYLIWQPNPLTEFPSQLRLQNAYMPIFIIQLFPLL